LHLLLTLIPLYYTHFVHTLFLLLRLFYPILPLLVYPLKLRLSFSYLPLSVVHTCDVDALFSSSPYSTHLCGLWLQLTQALH
jgi:hypothetical protein